jgi:hypothetical protein
MENSALTFYATDALECTTWPADPIGRKNTSLA